MAYENGQIVFETFEIEGKDFFDAGKVSTEIKSMLKELGINPEIVRRVAIAMYEAEMNAAIAATPPSERTNRQNHPPLERLHQAIRMIIRRTS